MKVQILINSFRVQLARDVAAFKQGFDLARKNNLSAIVVVVKLLDAKRVAGQGQLCASLVPVSESEDTRDVQQRVWPFFFDQVQKCFGVRGAAERMAL